MLSYILRHEKIIFTRKNIKICHFDDQRLVLRDDYRGTLIIFTLKII